MQSENLESLILSALFYNDSFTRKVLPFLKPEYFEQQYEQELFRRVDLFILTYNNLPTKEAIGIQVSESKDLSQSLLDEIRKFLSGMSWDEKTDETWLLEHTEKWCKKRAFVLALTQCVGFVDETEKNLELGAAPKIMQDAISISFDPSIGHDFIEDAEERYEFYVRKEEKVPFDLEYFNRITNEGVPKKTLNLVLAPTGLGKSLMLTHFASANLVNGFDVLYITLEMARERIAERVDANLLDVKIQDLKNLTKIEYREKIEKLKSRAIGKLIIEEFPTGASNVNHFRRLLDELYLKRNFKPSVIYIDYLNLANSSRIKANGSMGSYFLVKSIAEEFRGMAVEYDVPVFSATQASKGGYRNAGIDLEHVSESYGTSSTVDLFFALYQSEELEKLNQLVVKQLKNRYNDVANPRKFLIGIDKSKMRLYDLDEEVQKTLTQNPEEDEEEDTGPAFDKGKCGERIAAEDRGFGKRKKFNKFAGFNYN